MFLPSNAFRQMVFFLIIDVVFYLAVADILSLMNRLLFGRSLMSVGLSLRLCFYARFSLSLPLCVCVRERENE